MTRPHMTALASATALLGLALGVASAQADPTSTAFKAPATSVQQKGTTGAVSAEGAHDTTAPVSSEGANDLTGTVSAEGANDLTANQWKSTTSSVQQKGTVATQLKAPAASTQLKGPVSTTTTTAH